MSQKQESNQVTAPPPRPSGSAPDKVPFEYVAMDGSGRELRGTLRAVDDVEAVAKLKQQGLFPIEVWKNRRERSRVRTPRPGETFQTRSTIVPEPGVAVRLLKNLGFAARIKSKILAVFTRQLATMLDAGLPLMLSLRTLHEQCGRSYRYRTLRKTLDDVVYKVEGGMSLSEALDYHPRSFGKLYTGLVRAGEASGALEEVLGRLADYIERAERMKRKIKAGMTYPIVVLTIATAITLGLMIFVVPQFAEMFDELLEGVPLPKLTYAVINFSEFLVDNIKWLIGGLILVVILMKAGRNTRRGRYLTDWWLIRMPPTSVLVVKTSVARFSSTLGTLLDAGVPILEALNIVGETATNQVMRRTIGLIFNSVSEGERIAPPLESMRVFPQMVVRMIDIGEQTGALPDMLKRLARTYEEEVESTLEALISLIEPVMICVLAVLVGCIVIALFLPLVKIIETLGV